MRVLSDVIKNEATCCCDSLFHRDTCFLWNIISTSLCFFTIYVTPSTSFFRFIPAVNEVCEKTLLHTRTWHFLFFSLQLLTKHHLHITVAQSVGRESEQRYCFDP
jgi:hypothetical protein